MLPRKHLLMQPPRQNPDGTTLANTDEARQPEESNDSSGTINWVELEENYCC